MRSAPERPLRVLHGPANVGNQPWVLSRAERGAGLSSDLVVTQGSWLGYRNDVSLRKPGDSRGWAFAKQVGFGLRSPMSYDVLHYYFGQSYVYWPPRIKGPPQALLMADLKLARRFGRKIFMTLQGCDARLAAQSNQRNEFTMCADGRCGLYQTCREQIDARRQWLIDEILPLCDHVFYLNPEIGHYVPRGTFLPYCSVEIDSIDPAFPDSSGRPRIVHAPTNGPIKGTPHLLAALKALEDRFEFELVLVEGVPHSEALEIYRSADLALDQMWAGWYGGLAVEMMALGKPVAAYIREDDLRFVPEAMRKDLPVLCIRPDRVVDDLAAILQRRSDWSEIGRSSRAFAERWHHPDRIAKAMNLAYRSPQSTFQLD